VHNSLKGKFITRLYCTAIFSCYSVDIYYLCRHICQYVFCAVTIGR